MNRNKGIVIPVSDENFGKMQNGASLVSMVTDFQCSDNLVTLSFHNINYTIKSKKSLFGACRKKNFQKILTSIRYM